MDERLNRSNRLPGSEKLTRPEEIGQLSKYLKSIKEVYEESTRLEDQVLGVTGHSTGKIPEINSLGRKTIKTPTNQGETPDLSQKILGVPGKKWEEKLVEKKVGLKDITEPTELDNRVIISPENQGGEVSRLEEVIKKIQDVRDQKLGGKRLNLLDERIIALEDTRLDLQAMINTSLENKRIDLKNINEGIELEDKRIDLKNEQNPELPDKFLSLEDTREPNLSDKILKIEETREIELGNKRLDIQDDGINSLENKRINLSAEKEIELRDKRIKLRDEQEPELETTRLNLKDERSLELGDKRVDLKDDKTPKLETTRINLSDNRETKLEDKKIELKDDKEVELENTRLDIKDENNPELSDKTIGLKDDRDSKLEDTRINLKDDRDTELSNTRLDITDERESILSDKRIDIEDLRDNELENTRLDLEDSREVGLSDKILGILDERNHELSRKRLDLKDERDVSLSDKILGIKNNRENELENKVIGVLENENGEPTELYDSMLIAPENENGEPTELYDAFLGMAENKGGNAEELEDKVIDGLDNQGGIAEKLGDKRINLEDNRDTKLSDKTLKVEDNQGTAPNIYDVNSLKEYTSGLSDAELYEFAMGLVSEGDKGSGETDGWLEKIGSLMSAYLSSGILTPKRAIEFRDAINNTLEVSYFGSQIETEFRQNSNGDIRDSYYTIKSGEKSKPIPFPDSESETIKDGDVENLKSKFLRVPIDTSSGTTWAKAEEAVGELLTGTNRRDALDEMIVKIVDYKKSNLPRLPGSDLVDAAKGSVKNVVGVVTGAGDHPNPMNKPLHLNGMKIPGGYGDTLYQAANNRTQITLDSDPIDVVGDTIGNTFYNRYWKAKSFKTTLEDLCPIVGKAPIASLTELKAILKSSPYFTSPGKFTTDTKGSYNTFSLDTNMYWEVTIEPFCSKKEPCSNGGYSFLPSIREINFLNKELHGVSTNYGYWAPINSFELQKSKLSTKTLPLYEGEIAYPTGMEFTNELRLTFVDDAWKSWKRYFERCAEVAVYNSKAWNKYHYEAEITDFTGITKIDKTNFCVSSYKNLAFNIKIYILNPQLNQINKFNLLCVLKDYVEEYVGEIDAGGTDLNVSFSIVGENPTENSVEQIKVSEVVITNLARQALLETQKRVSGAINSSVGLL